MQGDNRVLRANLNRGILPVLAWGSCRHKVPRHPNYALHPHLVALDGDFVRDKIADGDAAAKAAPHVDEDPIAKQVKRGEHGRTLRGRHMVDFRKELVGQGGYAYATEPEAEIVLVGVVCEALAIVAAWGRGECAGHPGAPDQYPGQEGECHRGV